MSYSPGPWRSEGGSIKALSHGKEYTVAIVDRKKFTPEGRVGNARLIAAAPEMLEALKTLYEHCAMIHKTWGDGCNQKQANAAIAVGLYVIAKAEGRE